ncbi:MAG TPA: serine/threonine-protein kinase [Nocardioides sp.]|nr:serine/threonine-protein kinase [Nocardioides sp.]
MADQTAGTPDTAPSGGQPVYADARERYRLDEPIATGGMGQVWRATDTVLDRQVAVKQLLQGHADDAVFRARFETEAQHAAGLRHPGVAQVFDFGAGDTDVPGRGGHPPYLVMEYVVGRPLSALLRSGEPMEPDAAAALLAGAGDALGAAHAQGIVHRDVKPANLLVTDDRQVKITDFGIARATDAVALTRTGEVLGTPQYLSPEQAEGKQATPASDVYSLGAVAFECLAGRRPYVAESPVATAIAHLREPVPELPATVPPALAAVVRRALAKDPTERYADGAAFAAAIREATAQPTGAPGPVTDPATTRVMTAPVAPVVTGAGVTAGRSTTETAWKQRARAVPVPVWAAAGVFVVVLAIAALAAASSGGSPAPATQRSRHTSSTQATSAPASSSPTSPSPSTSAPTGPPPKQPKPDKPGKAKGHEHGKGHQ